MSLTDSGWMVLHQAYSQPLPPGANFSQNPQQGGGSSPPRPLQAFYHNPFAIESPFKDLGLHPLRRKRSGGRRMQHGTAEQALQMSAIVSHLVDFIS